MQRFIAGFYDLRHEYTKTGWCHFPSCCWETASPITPGADREKSKSRFNTLSLNHFLTFTQFTVEVSWQWKLLGNFETKGSWKIFFRLREKRVWPGVEYMKHLYFQTLYKPTVTFVQQQKPPLVCSEPTVFIDAWTCVLYEENIHIWCFGSVFLVGLWLKYWETENLTCREPTGATLDKGTSL